MEKLYLRPEETADALGLGRSKTYALISAGTIPSVRLDGSILVPVNALRDWARKLNQRKRHSQGQGVVKKSRRVTESQLPPTAA